MFLMPARLGYCLGLLFFLVLSSAIDLRAAPPPKPDEDKVKSIEKKIRKAIRAGRLEHVLSHAKALSSIKGAKATEVIFDAGMQVDDPTVFKGISKILAKRKDKASLEFFRGEAQGKKESRLVYLADSLALAKTAEAAEIVGELVKNDNGSVLRAAIESLQKIRKRQCIPPLLDLLARLDKKKDFGLVYQEVRDVLYALTEEDFDLVADWLKWWDPVKNSFVPGKKPEGQTEVVRKSREKFDTPKFVGRQIFSKNTVFVIDNSGTMRLVEKHDIPGLTPSDGTDAGRATGEADEQITPENARLARFWSRLEMAKRAFQKALDGIEPDVRINVIEFNRKVKPFYKKLTKASRSAKKKLGTKVKKMAASQVPGTDTLGAIKAAFKSDQKLSEIYFLSDGLPSKTGEKNDDPIPLLAKVESLNRFRKVKIHTFGYDPQGIEELATANSFLKSLAERTGGTFTLLKVTDEQPPSDFN